MARQSSPDFKDTARDNLIFQGRLLVAILIVVVLLLVLLARLAYLQIVSQQHYTTLSESNRVSIRPIAPTRGLIYDRNGILLAQNLPSFTLSLVPEHISNLDQTLAEIGDRIQLSEFDLERFHTALERKRRFEGVPLRFRLTDEEVARIASDLYLLRGVELNAELARHYPLGNLAVHAVGYVSRISESDLPHLDNSNYSATNHIGKVGVERYYEDILHGQVGYQRVETNAQGRIINVLERTLPVPGQNLYLNLDARLQAVAESSFNGQNGGLVAIDPRNGAVLAFASMPTYDPNLFVNGVDHRTYNELVSSPEQPLFNRALRGQYPPGSTIKPFVGLAGLELDVMRADQSLQCQGFYMLKNDDRRYRDWRREGHGETDLIKAIAESCDVYFYDLAQALDIDRMHQYLAQFGLGQRTGIDIRGELPGLLPSREWKRRAHALPWFPGETLITGIGQGFMLTTPLQLADITATLSQLGKRRLPRLVYAIQNPTNHHYEILPDQVVGEVPRVHDQHWNTVIDGMREVVHGRRGTARGTGMGMKYRSAGKTGTAQVFGLKQDEEYVEEEVDKRLRDHALFIAYAPLDDPRIAVAVIVENGGSGSSVAAPIARRVMDHYLLRETQHEPD